MASYEPSEIMTAAALLFTDKELDKYSESSDTLKQMMVDSIKKVETNVEFGSISIKNGFMQYLGYAQRADKDEKELTNLLSDLAGGISAAKGVRSYMKMQQSLGNESDVIVYMTGDTWPKDVEDFKVNAYGFKDYNSSDIMVTKDKKVFFGVSLKKKRKVEADEPTLINKAFDTLLQGEDFDFLKKELEEGRRNYFTELVIRIIESGLIDYKDINDTSGKKLKDKKAWNSFKSSPTGKKELYEAKKRDKKLFDRAYIDTKGSELISGGYISGKTTSADSVRYFVNKELSKKDCPLWKYFTVVINENSELFADALVNCVLKVKLFDEIDADVLKKKKFHFVLVTGVGIVSTKGVVNVGKATILPLKTTLCGLTRIDEKFKNQQFKVEVDNSKQDEADAAKVFLTLKRGTTDILNLQLRYKGSFTAQPQFLGTIAKDFKGLLEDECGF